MNLKRARKQGVSEQQKWLFHTENNGTPVLSDKSMIYNPCHTRSRMEQENMMILSFWAWLLARTCAFSKARRASSSIACSGSDQSLLHQSSSRSQPVLPKQFSLSLDFCTLIDFSLLPFPLESHTLVAGVKFAAGTSQTSTPFAANNELWMLRSCKPRPPRFGYRAHPVYTFGECET